MSTLLLAPPPVEHEPRARERAFDDQSASSAAPHARIDSWACGFDASDPAARDTCRDINPELIIELL